MVLDNASADPPSSDAYEDAFPTSEAPFKDSANSDNYAASSSSSSATRISVGPGVSIDLNRMPRPLSLFLLDNSYAKVLEDSIKESVFVISNTTQRPARQEEVDALAFHTAKGIRLASYGTPIGAVLGAAIATRGHSTYRFPFWSPMKEGGRFSPNRFPFVGFGGLQARIWWQLMRYASYGGLGALMGSIFFGSYGLTVSMQGRITDPRLKDFMDALRAAQRSGKNIRELMGQKEGAPGVRPRDNETFEMARQRAGVQEQWKQDQRQTQAAQRRVTDDASPTGGIFSDEFTSAPAETARQLKSTAKQPPQYDNAWEKLRQGAAGERQRDSNSSQERGPTARNDSFDFSSAGRDVPGTRSNEQKQFDTRLQREREGKDFDERGSGGWKS